MNDFTKMFSQAKKIQEKIKDAQENIKKIEVEGISGG
jgi:DNA-binding protein YbaB